MPDRLDLARTMWQQLLGVINRADVVEGARLVEQIRDDLAQTWPHRVMETDSPPIDMLEWMLKREAKR